MGVRALLCYGATDRHGEKGARAGLVECERALRAGRSAMVGLHAGFTVHDQTLDWAAELCRLGEAWLHVHAAEDRCDGESFARLEEHGLIGPRTILAHGVHLTPGERARAAAVGAWIVHNPRSNLQNAVGYADPNSIPGPTALGTDGMDGDLFTEARVAHLAGRQAHGPLGGIDAFGLVTGSQRLGDALLGPRPGDWIVLDYDPPTPLDAGNFPGHFLFGLGATHVRDVIVNGELVVEGRRPTLVDRHEVMARAREQAARLWKRL